MHADLILFNGHIETMDEHAATAQAVAVADGRFVAVGERSLVEQWVGSHTRRLDLAGRTLLPGFVDTHMHLEKIVRELAMLHLEHAQSLADLLAALHTVAARTPPGEWIQSFGDDGAWHEGQLAEQRLPHRLELDQVAPYHPVFLFRGPEMAVLNSRAIEALTAALSTELSTQWDSVTGVWRGPQVKPAQRGLPTSGDERTLQILAQGCEELLRMGVTTVVDPGLPAHFAQSWSLYTTARARGLLPQRVQLMNRFDFNLPFAQEMARLQAGPILPNQGDDRLAAGAVKWLLDGEFTDAWMRPEQSTPGVQEYRPARRYRAVELDQMLDLCSRHGWPLCVHTIGGGAIDFVVEGVRRAQARGATLTPGQVSLAHAFFPSSQSMAVCAQLGIFLSVHPLLAYVFEEEMQNAWGEFARGVMPLATMLAQGVAVAGGSDVLPCEPLRGAAMAVTRICRHGFRLDATEALAPRDALLLFTRFAGRYVEPRAEHASLGVIRPGAHADFTVWAANPLDLPPAQWAQMRAQLTAVAGEIVWASAMGPVVDGC